MLEMQSNRKLDRASRDSNRRLDNPMKDPLSTEPLTADPKLDNMGNLRTVHDMRRLRPCVGCAGLGDRLQMVFTEGKLWHTSCYRQTNGFKAVLALPKAQREKFRICDLTRGEMQRLLEQ